MRHVVPIPGILLALSLLWLPACGGDIHIDTIDFLPDPVVAAEYEQPVPGLRPSVDVNTNITDPGLFVREYRSRSPYGIRLRYTDPTQTFAELVLEEFAVSYADGAIESNASEQTLPMRYKLRANETVNSTNDGVTRSTVRVLDAELKGVITRDEEFRVRIAGHLVKEEGEVIPFDFTEQFTPVRHQRTMGRLEAYQDV